MIREQYSNVVLGDLIRSRYLAHGRSPDPDQILALAGQVNALSLGVEGSRVMFEPLPDEEGSAGAMMKAIEVFSQEIRSIFGSARLLNDTTSILFDRAENRLELLGQQASDLLLTACALRVARQDGFSLVSLDALSNISRVDQQKSTAEFDQTTNAVRLKKQKNEIRVDLTHLSDENFDVFMAVGEDAGLSQAPGSRFFHAVDDSDSFWLQRAISPESTAKTMIFQMDMGQILVISRISLEPLGSDLEGSNLIRVMASANGVNWREITRKKRSTTKTISAESAGMKARYIRIEMTREKASYQLGDQAGNFVFDFGINNLRVYETKYFPTGNFVSRPIQFKNTLGVAQRVNRMKFDVFEEKPDGTDITYYISRSIEDLGSATRVDPGEELVINTVSSVATDGKVRSRFNTNHALVNIPVPTDVIPESIRFFRNSFQQNVVIDGVQAGWRLENSYFRCVFELEEELEINLGINFAYIDGRKVNGIQVMQPGFHIFRTHATNWAEAVTEESDPLFPHNHKLLIEGLKGSTVYTGVDFQAADEMQLISAWDLLNIVDDDGRNRFLALYSGFPMIKIPRPPADLAEIEGWRREQHAIRYKHPADEQSITSVVLIGRMKTSNVRFTPVFKGFTASAGY